MAGNPKTITLHGPDGERAVVNCGSAEEAELRERGYGDEVAAPADAEPPSDPEPKPEPEPEPEPKDEPEAVEAPADAEPAAAEKPARRGGRKAK